MIFKLETPEHQRTAIQSVVEVFRGMEKNTYDNATDEDIRANYCSLSLEALMANINKIAAENGIDPLQTYFQESRNACIEMETGTGKTLTYIQSAYELYKEYGLIKASRPAMVTIMFLLKMDLLHLPIKCLLVILTLPKALLMC